MPAQLCRFNVPCHRSNSARHSQKPTWLHHDQIVPAASSQLRNNILCRDLVHTVLCLTNRRQLLPNCLGEVASGPLPQEQHRCPDRTGQDRTGPRQPHLIGTGALPFVLLPQPSLPFPCTERCRLHYYYYRASCTCYPLARSLTHSFTIHHTIIISCTSPTASST